MVSRTHSARGFSRTGLPGKSKLTLAYIIVTAESLLKLFARPLALGCAFIACAWLGLFAVLSSWMHLALLAVFILLFFDALGIALAKWKPLSHSVAKRRIEEASQLCHRPLDVLEDRPVATDMEQWTLWQTHVARAREQASKLRWPKWKSVFGDEDHYALRYMLIALLAVGVLFGWGALGGRLIAAINPDIAKLEIIKPALDAWITPPAYTHLPPIMIATPAGMRYEDKVIDVPAGSIITAHLAERDGDAPELAVNDSLAEMTADTYGDFEASRTIRSGDTVSIRRGWNELGSWRIHVVADKPPQIAFAEPPSSTERKAVRLSYDASDDYGVKDVSVRITPRESLPGATNDPIELPISEPDAKEVKRVDFEDLTAHPWSGLPVQIQLIATDAAGHKSVSETADFTLPERIFFQPVARALIDERKKLLLNPDDDSVRNETANVMAGIAHQPSAYRGDPVVLMALRSGAVRLVLDRSHDAVAPTTDTLWKTAVRIEDGATGFAEQNLRQAQKELADALDRRASEQDIQQLIDRLHQALAQYLSELSTRIASRPGPVEDMSQILGPQTNVLTPQDINRMLQQMRDLSASGDREAAQQELSRLRQLLENLRTQPTQFTEEQKQQMRNLRALRELTQQQKQLLDKTFQSTQSGDQKNLPELETSQNNLLKQLQDLMKGLGGKNDELTQGADAMQRADGALQQGVGQRAVRHQTDAVKALEDAAQNMTEDLRASMMMLPQPGMQAAGQDPFGRGFSGLMRDEGGVKIPDQMQVRRVREILNELQRRAGDMGRPKEERDYIERLLQNF